MMRWTLDHGNPLPPGWSYLPRDEESLAWDRFLDRFQSFRPSVYPKDWPAVVDPNPSVTFDLAVPENSPGISSAQFDAINAEAQRRFVSVFDDPGWIVLDWQHPGYRLDAAVHADTFDTEWPVTVCPNGDYYIFARPDFSTGTFGHPWEKTLCVFGAELVQTLGQTLATWLPLKREKQTDIEGTTTPLSSS
ncbi:MULTISPECIES: DUF2716 domain-containing protein [unclassified Gordonia (in: high G+C Gram-positive bacteria)]|uniref:DUF2716 domain-containing protein n=1 Tax=unclassified Gordonia (in: high G+C Gram-positive bacteria) TaxID=2657482 RepID=UPI0009910D27|nr:MULTISPECIES: DUF2716 domain-containing protein [unclassified Gordonia (in: high G+C Gram-positive bacteria)]MCX2756756.1 DUF2716 domain-containing protein [Gordonia sp. 4N]